MDLSGVLVRLALWARRRPSRRHVQVMIAVIVLAAVCVLVESVFGWPDWLTVERLPRYGSAPLR